MRAALLCVALFWLAGCGFALRGSDVATHVEAAFVRAAPRVDVSAELERSLRDNGVRVLDAADPDAVTIELFEQQQDRRIVATTEQAQAAEYRLELRVRYSIIGALGTVLVPQTWATTTRVVSIDRNNLVGSSQEQVLVRGEMSRELVQQILRSLAATTRAAAR
jgi:LPS-assembly lipoprotein